MTGFDQSDQERLRQLDERIAAQSGPTAAEAEAAEAERRQEARASRAGYELLGAVLGGLLMGYVADQLFGKPPVGVIAGLFLGFGAGVFNAWRAAQGVERAVGLRTAAPDNTAAKGRKQKNN